MQSLEQQWERIRIQTSWKLECCHKPASSEVPPANDNNPGVSSFFSSEVADERSMWGEHPGKHLHIMYFNARRLCPKIDELRVLCDLEKLEIVCITETWLCNKMVPQSLPSESK